MGGYIIAKLRYHSQINVRQHVDSTNPVHRHLIQLSQAKICLLSLVSRTTQQINEETIDSLSLHAINRKQNIRDSLTHLSDQAYDLFVQICSVILRNLKNSNLFKHKEQLYEHVVSLLKADVVLLNKWEHLFSDHIEFPRPISLNERAGIIVEMYRDMCPRLCKVFVNQFRKDFLDQHGKKNKALRAGLKMAEAKGGSKCEPFSHECLKTKVENGETLNFVVKDLKMLCDFYLVACCSKDKKKTFIQN